MARKLLEGELEFAALYRAEVHTFSDEQLDRDRRLGEQYGDEITIGDLTGWEMAGLCDAEIAGRYVSARVEA